MEKITEEQHQYVIDHINDRPRNAVAKAAGTSLTTVYRIVREYGGELRYDLRQPNEQAIEATKKYYATMTGHAIARMIGCSRGLPNVIAARLGLKHNEGVVEEALLRVAKNRKQSPESYLKGARKRAARRKLDEYRVWEGKPQLTRMKLRKIGLKAYKAKWHLVSRYGYYESDEPYTLLYDRQTRRRPVAGSFGSEEYYTKKYRLMFEEDE